MPKKVTSPKSRRKQIVDRLKYYRNAQARVYSTEGDAIKNSNGQLLDAALSYIEVAKQQQATRDENWTKKKDSVQLIGGIPIPAGGSPKGYSRPKQMSGHWPWDNQGLPPGNLQESLYQAAACILAELERMQYSDEIAVGYKPRLVPSQVEDPYFWSSEVAAPTWPSTGSITTSRMSQKRQAVLQKRQAVLQKRQGKSRVLGDPYGTSTTSWIYAMHDLATTNWSVIQPTITTTAGTTTNEASSLIL